MHEGHISQERTRVLADVSDEDWDSIKDDDYVILRQKRKMGSRHIDGTVIKKTEHTVTIRDTFLGLTRSYKIYRRTITKIN